MDISRNSVLRSPIWLGILVMIFSVGTYRVKLRLKLRLEDSTEVYRSVATKV
jgi:hypothetical protein